MTTYNYYIHPHRVELESGQTLGQLRIAYSVEGNPAAEKTVWVCHALSGDPDVCEWWPGLFGDQRLFNFQDYRIICANVIGSCYGSTGPDDVEELKEFPLITIRDMVQAHQLLADHLGINEVDILIGASLGGQQAVEWGILNPDFAKKLILIATNAIHSSFGKAFNESQRMALKADPTFGKKGGGTEGLKAARAIAMLSYRSYQDFETKQRDESGKLCGYKACSYVSYQGKKFIKRFSAGSYYILTLAMDSHDVSRGAGSLKTALEKIHARTLVVGIDSDQLFPLSEQQFLADHIPGAELGVIRSVHGHDAFLIEYLQLEDILKEFLFNDFKRYKPTVFKQIKI